MSQVIKPSAKPRILIVGPTPPPHHGVAISTQLILDSPALDNFEILHLDTRDTRTIENIGKFDLGNIYLGILHSLKCVGMLLRRPALIYLPISQGPAGFLRDNNFILSALFLRVPIILHLRGSEFRSFHDASPAWMQSLIRFTLGKICRMIVLGESIKPIFHGLVPQEKLVVIPNGEPDLFEHREQPEAVEECTRVLFLSNLRTRKGVFIVLEAALEILETHRDIEFIFAGEWETMALQEQARQFVKHTPFGNRIHFPGFVEGENKLRILLSSDIFIFPPIKPEGHPRVVLEAMAAGLPIITTDQGAIKETVVDGKTGFIVPTGETQPIIEKICLLADQPALRKTMGKAARERFLAHYTAEKANQHLAQVFDEVINK